MHTHTFTFKVLSFCGVWLPLHWQCSQRLKFLYNLFGAITVSLIYSIFALQGILLVVSEYDLSVFTGILFTLLTGVSICAKAANFLVRRQKVIRLADMLLKSWCVPRTAEESEMQRKTAEFVRVFTISFNIMGQLTVLGFVLMPLSQEPEIRDLPFRVWLPFNVHSRWRYWVSYFALTYPLAIGTLLNVTTDIIVSSFVMQACTQLDILKHRLNELPNVVKLARRKGHVSSEAIRLLEHRTLEQTVLHHDYIIKYAKVVTETFDVIIVEQFFAGAIVFSIIVYELTRGNGTLIQKCMSLCYITCMLWELFSYCWFANELTLKSIELCDDVYRIDWTELSEKSNKKLIFIMMRTRQPIIMSYANLVVLNIDSFKSYGDVLAKFGKRSRVMIESSGTIIYENIVQLKSTTELHGIGKNAGARVHF